MTFYEKKLRELRGTIYANQAQIDTIIRARNYLREHYGEPLNLDQLAQVHLVSKYHLLRLFKRYHGVTPRQFLIDVRIEKAKENLLAGKTVTDTCFAVGFESPGSFSSLFKRKTGKTPGQYQKEQLSRSNPSLDL
ncbi:AraC family transcriptional regulator [Lewinella sp. W8]|uniref:helix-turn-helix domain-containing protein n=1 Tax=Lewinella sp. W8 TaxID=2528208 RepID=UPI00106768AA|nr:AraC family transcriptional regulator [Lewinella sp. W8]MTB53525.1 helix-turn-helix domain-containing protein [Lewinella sp. W8]